MIGRSAAGQEIAAVTSLTHTKCFNHGHREAVARCPECKRHYCRECVTEHAHRLLCASCIAAIDVEEESERRPIPVRGTIQFTAGIAMLWVAFYILGQSLLLIPSEYHESRNTLLEQIEAMDARDRAEQEEEGADEDSPDESADTLPPEDP